VKPKTLKQRILALAVLGAIVGTSLIGLKIAGVIGQSPGVASATMMAPPEGVVVGTQRGDIAPDFEISDLDGFRHRLSDFRGKVVLLNFWATWCVSCRFETPELYRFQQDHIDQVVVLSVNHGETAGQARSYLANFALDDGSTGVKFAIDAGDPDDTLYRAYRALGTPSSYFIDTTGHIAHTANGPLILPQMEQALETTP
jgi:thiol-disulfide isomerase/thioredoxin